MEKLIQNCNSEDSTTCIVYIYTLSRLYTTDCVFSTKKVTLFEEKESAANQNQIEEQNIKHENLPNIEYLVLEPQPSILKYQNQAYFMHYKK